METENRTAHQTLARARRIVVKVGSALLCGADGVRAAWLSSLAGDIAMLRGEGREVVVVTSGAIALGRRRLRLDGPLRLDEKQAASAAGQAALVEAWQAAFAPHDIAVAQILLTLDDTEDRRRYLNARATFATLLELAALPLVNENDTIATAEIRYGDNDRLAAHAAQIAGAELLVILSDIDGVYDADPRRDATARRLPLIEHIGPDIIAAAGGANAGAGVGSGGMASKIAAAGIAAAAGAATIIAPGTEDHPLKRLLDGGPSTLILAATTAEKARRQWIGGRLKPQGEIRIDAGAAKALLGGASLLPAGVVSVAGEFQRGDAVLAVAPDGAAVAQGLSAYGASELRLIAGKRSDEIEKLLGYRRRPAVIEKDDLALRTAAP
ncbi:MAG TPA: glutamate 5-kinase [Parvularcula sp.]|nr:glutamate 5-kinase [Parvularcula sp.]HBS30394.1 glutamate 5-kinase [Parvularcula sp.]HBS35774.1 glutamate 5-kinase [Parvularcula sp.]